MTREELLAYCLAKPGAWQDEPWEGDVVVKAGPKIFAFWAQDRDPRSASKAVPPGKRRRVAHRHAPAGRA